jgi:DeoR/GlpR family transcriptional regulator of sugar metabolism
VEYAPYCVTTRPSAAAAGPNGALPARRRSELLELAKNESQVTVTDLASKFGVSPDTIRRDLDLLAGRGLLERTHGGAVPASLVTQDSPLDQRIVAHKPAKQRIARTAAGLIRDGETLMINGGSTTLAFAGELGARRDLTIVTNNLQVPAAVPVDAVRDLYVLGGQYRFESQVTIGAVGFATVPNISADTAVIGVGAITVDGVSTSLLVEAEMMRAMIGAARRTIVLADASKFGHSSFALIVSLRHVEVLVTDQPPSGDVGQALAEAQVQLVLAPSPAAM